VAVVSLAFQSLISANRTGCGALVERAVPVLSVSELTASDFHRDPGLFYHHKAAGVPVVVRGLLEAEVASGMWTPASLATEFKGHSVNVALGNVEQAESGAQMELDFADFTSMVMNDTLADELERGEGVPYLAEVTDQWTKSERVRKAAESIVDQSLNWATPFVTSMMFWMGPKHTLTGLHADTEAMNVLHQLYGSKTMWMFPPSQVENLYPSDKYDNGATNFLVDPFNPDTERFPRYTRATPVNVTVNAGDALFVPYGWPHYVRSETASVSLSGRSYSVCEVAAHLPTITFSILHRLGLYKDRETCACHISRRAKSDATYQGTNHTSSQ